ncbi:hypothetical protein D3C86_558550 [compost metagenome]
MQKRKLLGLMALSCLMATPAHALEAWTSYEVRMPFDDAASPGPHWVKLANDLRYGPNYPGIGQVLVRVGPVWEVHPALTVATHFTTNAERQWQKPFSQELRLELEPTARWRWGDVRASDRLRLERRMFFTESRWRLRNRVQFNYQPDSWSWAPFIWNEVFLEDGAFNQNRASVGVSLPVGKQASFRIGYLLRSREGSADWDHTHALSMGFTFSPVVDPLIDDGPGI